MAANAKQCAKCLKTHSWKIVLNTIASTHSPKEVERALVDFLTPAEIRKIEDRVKAALASQIPRNGLPQTEVARLVGISYGTYLKGKQLFENGKGGFRMALDVGVEQYPALRPLDRKRTH